MLQLSPEWIHTCALRVLVGFRLPQGVEVHAAGEGVESRVDWEHQHVQTPRPHRCQGGRNIMTAKPYEARFPLLLQPPRLTDRASGFHHLLEVCHIVDEVDHEDVDVVGGKASEKIVEVFVRQLRIACPEVLAILASSAEMTGDHHALAVPVRQRGAIAVSHFRFTADEIYVVYSMLAPNDGSDICCRNIHKVLRTQTNNADVHAIRPSFDTALASFLRHALCI